MISSAKVYEKNGEYFGKGYEFGWRRFGSSVIRLYRVKASREDYLKYLSLGLN
jgi:hypothetical protein